MRDRKTSALALPVPHPTRLGRQRFGQERHQLRHGWSRGTYTKGLNFENHYKEVKANERHEHFNEEIQLGKKKGVTGHFVKIELKDFITIDRKNDLR